MLDKNVEAFFKPNLKMGNVVSSTESGKLGVIIALQANDDGLLYGGLRFDGKRFICREDQVNLVSDTIESYISNITNCKPMQDQIS